LLVQFWCSYGILPLYAIVTQMGSRFKKALIREEIRESLHGWRKRVKERAKRESSHPSTTAKSEIVSQSVAGDIDEIGNELAAHSLSRSVSNVTRKSTSLPREISITCQTENWGEDHIHQGVQQEEELGSHITVYSFRSSKNELDVSDDDDTDKHLLGSSEVD
ncbi:hypothetical protein KI387_019524, partial [Taxus chinensis]